MYIFIESYRLPGMCRSRHTVCLVPVNVPLGHIRGTSESREKITNSNMGGEISNTYQSVVVKYSRTPLSMLLFPST